jgi:hypothetical protein
MTPSPQPDLEFLLSHGWRQRDSKNPWRWELKRLPGAFYKLKDAVNLQKQMDRKKGKQVSA